MHNEFDPPIGPGDDRYVQSGAHLTAHDGSPEGDCSSVSKSLSYICTLDEGHTGHHVAHGTEIIQGKRVDLMYAEWDDEDSASGMTGEKPSTTINREVFANLVRRILHGDRDAAASLREMYGGQSRMLDDVIEAVVQVGESDTGKEEPR